MKFFPYFLILGLFLFILTGCEENEEIAVNEEEEKEKAERGLNPSYPNLHIDSLTVATIREEIDETNTAASAFNNFITTKAKDALSKNPLPFTHINPDNESTVKEHTETTLTLAIQWIFEEDSTQKQKYLQKTVDFLSEFSDNYAFSDHTPRETAILPLLEAYSIVRDALTEDEKTRIDKWLLNQAYYYKDELNLSGKLAINNWNTIRLNLLTYASLITESEGLYNHTISQLKDFIPQNIYEDGSGHDFEDRDAFAYHAYNLLFYAKIFKSIRLYKNTNLYYHTDFSRVKKAVDFWEPYLVDPENNKHLEFVDTHYEPDKQRSDYNQPYSPSSSIYVLEELVAIEPRCTDYINAINTSLTKYNLSFHYWVNQTISE
ncbi:MAG: alginate lyase family protein [Marinilabilia sp.]